MKYPQLVSMPSAVSDWLEEQLEARGIDAVVYTRYILSLLHSDDTLDDVIYSQHDELGLNNNKESRRRKRFKCSYSDWWRCAKADADKLKRTAAIECLTSATEESCGVESLIDELCDRLNEIKQNHHHTDNESINKTNSNPYSGLSPQELARKYYDAFPALGRSTLQTATMNTNPKATTSRNKRVGSCTSTTNHKQPVVKKARATAAEGDFEAILYDDLPVDISELLQEDDTRALDQQTPHMELLNLANMRDTGIRGFIPSGTNITSSIWSSCDTVLDLRFGSLDLGPNWPGWTPALSMFKLNHRKDVSAFVEVTGNSCGSAANPFATHLRPIARSFVKTVGCQDKEEDLLTSVRSHFIPIQENDDGTVANANTLLKPKYADGATFLIANSNWEPVCYRRTESGALYMENKRYGEYKHNNRTGHGNVDLLVLKYLVCQNDKACQTEEDAEVAEVNRHGNNQWKCTISDTAADADDDDVLLTHCNQCLINNDNEDTTTITATIWNNNVWENNNRKGGEEDAKKEDAEDQWDYTSLRDIWSGGEVCHSCLARPVSTVVQTKQLRDDISQDGDELLNDLSTLQKTYMLEENDQDSELPLNELSCDLTDLIFGNKRRHSMDLANSDSTTMHEEASWSFASRLEEDCLMQMSALPTLRSVTL